MPTIELYTMQQSPPCRLVEMVASLLDVEVIKHPMNLMAGDHLKEDFLKLNPSHKIPFLVDGELKMGESRAICQYLVNKYGGEDNKLYPKCPMKRAKVDEMLMFDGCSLYPALSQVYRPVFFENKGIDPVKADFFKQQIGIINDHLSSGSKFITGDDLTIADVSLASSLASIGIFRIDVSGFKYLMDYLDRCHEAIPKWKDINDEALEKTKNLVESKLAALASKEA